MVLSYAHYGQVAPWLKVVLLGALAFIAALVVMCLFLWGRCKRRGYLVTESLSENCQKLRIA